MADKYELNNEELSQVIGGLDYPDDAGRQYRGYGDIIKDGLVIEPLRTNKYNNKASAEAAIKQSIDNALLKYVEHVTSRYRIEYMMVTGHWNHTEYVSYHKSEV